MFTTDIYSLYSQTYTWVSASKRYTWAETFCTLYSLFVACGFYGSITKNAKNVFVFWKSLSNDGSRVALFIVICFALHIGVVAFVFRLLFCIFLYCPFLYHCMIFIRSKQQENIQIIRGIDNEKSTCHQGVDGWFHQLLTSVCTSPSSIWLPLHECLLSPERTLRGFFSDFFNASLTTLSTHRIIKVSKTLIYNHFFVRIMDLKKKCQDVTLCKKSLIFLEKILFYRLQSKKVLKI